MSEQDRELKGWHRDKTKRTTKPIMRAGERWVCCADSRTASTARDQSSRFSPIEVVGLCDEHRRERARVLSG